MANFEEEFWIKINSVSWIWIYSAYRFEVCTVDLPVIEAAVCIHHGILGDDLHGRCLDGLLGGPEGQTGHCGHHELKHVHRRLPTLKDNDKSHQMILSVRWAILRLNCKLRLTEIHIKWSLAIRCAPKCLFYPNVNLKFVLRNINLTWIVFKYSYFYQTVRAHNVHCKNKSANCLQENNLTFSKELYETHKHVL